MNVPEMDEKCILGGKAQSMGKAEERVFDNGNRRTGPKGKGRKEPASATVAKKESSVSKPVGKTTRMGEDFPVGKVAEMTEAPPVQTVPAKMPAAVPSVKPVPSKVATAPSVATSMPTKSPDMSC